MRCALKPRNTYIEGLTMSRALGHSSSVEIERHPNQARDCSELASCADPEWLWPSGRHRGLSGQASGVAESSRSPASMAMRRRPVRSREESYTQSSISAQATEIWNPCRTGIVGRLWQTPSNPQRVTEAPYIRRRHERSSLRLSSTALRSGVHGYGAGHDCDLPGSEPRDVRGD